MRSGCLFPMTGRWLGVALRALPILVLGLLLVGLSGCSSNGDQRVEVGDVDKDGAPRRPPNGLDSVPDAVPRSEPKAKYGNPKSYVVFGKRYYTKTSSRGHVETGTASWYGKKFHGRKTSSGERYNMYGMTAAHKSLPLPTYAKVTNLDNRRSVIVKINDRGPFHGNRVIDLSYAAATKLGVVKHGVAKVEVRAIDPSRPKVEPTVPDDDAFEIGTVATTKKAPTAWAEPARPAKAPVAAEPKVVAGTVSPTLAPRSGLYLQVGAFGDRINAEQLKARLVRDLEEQVDVKSSAGSPAPLYKVRVGPIASDTEAVQVSQKLAALGVSGSHRVFD